MVRGKPEIEEGIEKKMKKGGEYAGINSVEISKKKMFGLCRVCQRSK